MYNARIILDSIGPNLARLTTFELTYPRMVHAELMTHRMLSRNSASSRAIPVEVMLKQIEDDPALPVWWGKNQSGMQAKEELIGADLADAKLGWNTARDAAVAHARKLNLVGLHKQITNRVVEPWMFITVLVTATEFDNVRGLRVDPEAQPEIERIMHMAFDVFDASKPQELRAGQWHLPLVTGYDEEQLRMTPDGLTVAERDLCDISVGRCARVSYLTHEGHREPAADLKLARGRLLPSGHMSPFEHVAQAMTNYQWVKYAGEMADRWILDHIPMGNLWGWKQWRKEMRNEHNFMMHKAERSGT